MAKIFLGDVALSSWDLDSFSQSLLPVLCRSTGISFLEDKDGNFILEPPLGNKTIVLRPLTIPNQGLNALLTTLSQGLHERGANVLIVPATASDGRLFRLWQTQVLFAFTQKAAAAGPGLRFFYAPKRSAESLEVIAALVQAMLRSGNPHSYIIPGSWEHFKNFRYRSLLNNADVPSVLIEFYQASLEEEVARNIATWLVDGLTTYFRKPPDEDTVHRLQSLLQRFREACLLPAGKSMPWEREATVKAESTCIPDTKEILVPGTERAGDEDAEDTGTPAREVTIMTTPGEPAEDIVADVYPETTMPAGREIPILDEQPGTVDVKEEAATPEQVKLNSPEENPETTGQKDTAGTVPDQSSLPVSQPPLQAKSPLARAESPGTSHPVPGIKATAAGTGNQGLAPPPSVKGLDGKPDRRRQRGNPFAPPGDGPVFIFKRPLETTSTPSFFPQEVPDRMAPFPIRSTFLTAGQPWRYHAPYTAADITGVSPAASPAARPEVLQQPPEDLEPIRTATIRAGTKALETGKDNNPLAELKNLSAAILAPEQLQEPLNGEAPSN